MLAPGTDRQQIGWSGRPGEKNGCARSLDAPVTQLSVALSAIMPQRRVLWRVCGRCVVRAWHNRWRAFGALHLSSGDLRYLHPALSNPGARDQRCVYAEPQRQCQPLGASTPSLAMKRTAPRSPITVGAMGHILHRSALTCLTLTAMVWLTAAPALEIAAVALFKDRAVILIDGHQRTLKIGTPSPEGVRLLAADAAHARIEVNGVERELKLDGRIQDDFAGAPTAIIVRLVPGAGGHYFVDGQINGNPVNFLVDTGATTVVMNKNFARSIGVNYAVDGTPGAAETASGVVASYHVVLNEVGGQPC